MTSAYQANKMLLNFGINIAIFALISNVNGQESEEICLSIPRGPVGPPGPKGQIGPPGDAIQCSCNYTNLENKILSQKGKNFLKMLKKIMTPVQPGKAVDVVTRKLFIALFVKYIVVSVEKSFLCFCGILFFFRVLSAFNPIIVKQELEWVFVKCFY